MISIFKDDANWKNFVRILVEWIGTPYAHWQMEKGVGADCGLFLAKCLEQFGILESFEFERPPRFWHKFLQREIVLDIIKTIQESLVENNYNLVRVTDDKFIEGDILTFNLRSKLTNHIAMYFGNDTLINSINGKGVCLLAFKPVYKNRLTNKYRLVKCQ